MAGQTYNYRGLILVPFSGKLGPACVIWRGDGGQTITFEPVGAWCDEPGNRLGQHLGVMLHMKPGLGGGLGPFLRQEAWDRSGEVTWAITSGIGTTWPDLAADQEALKFPTTGLNAFLNAIAWRL